MCDNYLLSYYKDNIIEILKEPDEIKHFSVEIDFIELSGNDPILCNTFLEDPEKSLEEWNKAILKVQTNVILQSTEDYMFKKHTHCRIHSLPLYPELYRTKIPQLDDVNKFLQVSGTVVRMTGIKMMEYQRQYVCTKCKYVMTASAKYEMKNTVTAPRKCGNPEECRSTAIARMGELNAEFCKDYQEIKMQEIGGQPDAGSMPSSMWVTLEDDLVDSCQPGDHIIVCGLVKLRYGPLRVGKPIDCELVMKANHVQVNNNATSALLITPELKSMFKAFWKTYSETSLAARDMILKSICPEIFGLWMVKLAMAVVLAGGSNLQNSSNTGIRVRTEPHLLLVGDPGTGKSEFLRFASKLIPRSVLTTGVGSTAAGLTCAAVMENGEWQLEGGALVLSDGGICCIDEFNTLKENDRTSIHEAMEQQTISVAKAGIVCKLSTRCSVLAATNPKGKLLDPSQPLIMNVGLASPLLSRFDLILLLRDTFEEAWDNQFTDYVLSSLKKSNSSKLSENINWTIETLQAYFSLMKKIHPKLTEDSNKILSNYYQAQRNKNFRNKSRTTVRLLDSLVRLSQGHARLMSHEEVEILDAVTAVMLVELSLEAGASVFDLCFKLRDDFPHDPTSTYKKLVRIVLGRLDLNDLLEKELERMDKRPGPSGGNDNSPICKTEPKSFHVDDERVNKIVCIEKNRSGTGEDPSSVKSNIGANSNQETLVRVNKLVYTEKNKSAAGAGPSGVKRSIDADINHEMSVKEPKVTTESIKRNENIDDSTKVLSQRTKTRNRLSAFRCIPKDDKRTEPMDNQNAESRNNRRIGDIMCFVNVKSSSQKETLVSEEVTDASSSNRNIFDIGSDISFANVVTSTQSADSLTQRNDENPDEEVVQTTKKSSFEQIDDNLKLRRVVSSSPPVSIFETEEDIDFDL